LELVTFLVWGGVPVVLIYQKEKNEEKGKLPWVYSQKNRKRKKIKSQKHQKF